MKKKKKKSIKKNLKDLKNVLQKKIELIAKELKIKKSKEENLKK